MQHHALELQSVSLRYRAGVDGCSVDARALDAVSLAVPAGAVVGVVGDRGAGKTALLQCAAGLLAPDAGRVLWDGVELRAGVRPAYVPARAPTHPFLGVRAWLEFVASGCEGPATPDISAVLDQVGLGAAPGFRVGQLSPGMQARLNIAGALLGLPRLLLLDDPLAALSRAERRRYGTVLAELARDGIAVIVSARTSALLDGVPIDALLALMRGRVSVETPTDRTLEIDVGMPGEARNRLAVRVPRVRRRGRALRVPLSRISAEDVLSECRALGIHVYASRILTGGKVAENGSGECESERGEASGEGVRVSGE